MRGPLRACPAPQGWAANIEGPSGGARAPAWGSALRAARNSLPPWPRNPGKALGAARSVPTVWQDWHPAGTWSPEAPLHLAGWKGGFGRRHGVPPAAGSAHGRAPGAHPGGRLPSPRDRPGARGGACWRLRGCAEPASERGSAESPASAGQGEWRRRRGREPRAPDLPPRPYPFATSAPGKVPAAAEGPRPLFF